MDWLNKRVRLKPGVDPTDIHIGIVVSQLNPYQVKVNWGGTTSHEYTYVLEIAPVIGKGDVAFDSKLNPLGIVLLVHGDNIVVAASPKTVKVVHISEIRTDK